MQCPLGTNFPARNRSSHPRHVVPHGSSCRRVERKLYALTSRWPSSETVLWLLPTLSPCLLGGTQRPKMMTHQSPPRVHREESWPQSRMLGLFCHTGAYKFWWQKATETWDSLVKVATVISGTNLFPNGASVFLTDSLISIQGWLAPLPAQGVSFDSYIPEHSTRRD